MNNKFHQEILIVLRSPLKSPQYKLVSNALKNRTVTQSWQGTL